MLSLLAWPLLACSLALPQDPGADREEAFRFAAQNRGELERAWREVPEPQREAMQFLLTNLPVADAKTLAADFLLREVRQAYEARAAVPWGAALPDALFFGHVLPYAQANEDARGLAQRLHQPLPAARARLQDARRGRAAAQPSSSSTS
jgi:hypothetical protein